MWDKWFRQWIETIFWWLPSRERGEQPAPEAAKQRQPDETKQETAASSAEAPRSHQSTSAPSRGEAKPAQPKPSSPKSSSSKTAKKSDAKASASPRRQPAKEPAEKASGKARSREQPKGEPKSQPDDLTVLKGLGPAMQRKLGEIGITTFKGLTEADADALTDQLKATQRTVTKEKVQAWMAEAQKLRSS